MIRPPLPSEVFLRHQTDKCIGTTAGGHNYGPFLDDRLSHYRWCGAVLEIGILEGKSLRAFAEFCPDADVVGIDVVKGRLVNEGRIKSLCIDASCPHEMGLFTGEYAGHFSVCVDDGSHRLADQLLAASCFKKLLRPGGLAWIEDIASADYAPMFEEIGYKVVEFDTSRRRDDRIAFYIKSEDCL